MIGWIGAASLALAVGLFAPASAFAGPAARDDRAGYIAGLIAAIRGSDATTLTNTGRYVAVIEANKCRAPEQSIKIGCLLEAVAQNCRQDDVPSRERCLRISDVIVTNRLGEPIFVAKDVRYQLMSTHRDYKAAVAAELKAQHARHVAAFVMSSHYPGRGHTLASLANGIDTYCREVSGTRDLSWQYCVAAIVWFVATDGAGPERGGAAAPGSNATEEKPR